MNINTKVNTVEIEVAIMQHFDFRKNLIVTNISNMMNLVAFETDVIVLNKNNYAHGFEIKVSKSDLKAEFNKRQHTEFDLMRNGKAGLERFYGKFKYFSYAVPFELKDDALQLIPAFCGLWVCSKQLLPARTIFYCVRKPKKLFSYKWSEQKRYELARLGAMRVFGLKKATLDN